MGEPDPTTGSASSARRSSRSSSASGGRSCCPATIFFLSYYMGFILLCGYAQDFMASSVYEGLTVGYCLALTQFVMVFVLGILYLRKSDREYDPLAPQGRRDGRGRRARDRRRALRA